jgi:hypothetical protein
MLCIDNETFTGMRGNASLDTLMSMLSGLGSGGGVGVPNTSNGYYTQPNEILRAHIVSYFLV